MRPELRSTFAAYVLVAAAFYVPTAPIAQSGELDIFILAGQSNMSGRGALAELPPGFPRHIDRISVYANDGRWRVAAEPLDDPAGQIDAVSRDDNPGVGPGLAFADAYAAANPERSLGLVPCAKGGSRMIDWSPDASRERLYGSCLARVREASKRGRPRALLWYQGESDTRRGDDVAAWPDRLATLVDALRRDLGAPDLAVVVVRLPPIASDVMVEQRLAYWDDLRRVQASLRLRCASVLDVPTAGYQPDGVHLSTASQLALGRSLADALPSVTCEN